MIRWAQVSLVVLAAGSWIPEAIARGYAAVQQLHAAMDADRRQRQIRLGFPDDEAAGDPCRADAQLSGLQHDQQLVVETVGVELRGGIQHRPPLRIGGERLDVLADLVVQGGDPRPSAGSAPSRCATLSCRRPLLPLAVWLLLVALAVLPVVLLVLVMDWAAGRYVPSTSRTAAAPSNATCAPVHARWRATFSGWYSNGYSNHAAVQRGSPDERLVEPVRGLGSSAAGP